MAYPCITQPDQNTPLRLTLCLTKEECGLVLPFVKRALKAAQRKYDKCIFQVPIGGTATDKQKKAIIKAKDNLDRFKELHYHLDSLA